jgi:hypothetical protein
MNDKYEHPLPKLALDIDSLTIETKSTHTGQFSVKNTGGGVLKGSILSRCKGLVFEPREFEGSTKINYTFNAAAAGLGIGESLNSRFFVMSAGGEKEIPVSAKLIKMSVTTPDGYTIANIRDFYEYSQKQPTQARRLFIDSEFYMLLLASGYEFMEVYESLHKDANRERAMDNFFILSGLKERTELEVTGERYLEFTQAPGDTRSITGEFKVKKSDGGYADAPLVSDAPWLKLSSGKLSTLDFDEDTNTATVNFTINAENSDGSENMSQQIKIGTHDSVEIVYRRLPPLVLSLNRDTYRYSDKGIIKISNNTGKHMKIDVFCPEKYIHFSARSYPVDARGEIPFEIKLSGFMNAQRLLRKLPFMKTNIEIKAKIPGQEIKKTIPVIVGEW